MFDAAGAIILPNVGDLARIRALGAGQSTIWLTVTEGTPAAGGSTVTHLGSGRYRLRLDGSDTASQGTGIYTITFDFYDLSDGADWKRAGSRLLSVTN